MRKLIVRFVVTRLAIVGAGALVSCAPLHLGVTRDPSIVGEWVDTRHATPADTSLWVLRADGYDGSARLVNGHRSDTKFGRWFSRGSESDTAGRAICFSKRLGRDGATCLPFSMDTIAGPNGPVRRLIVRGYQGNHATADRILIDRKPGT